MGEIAAAKSCALFVQAQRKAMKSGGGDSKLAMSREIALDRQYTELLLIDSRLRKFLDNNGKARQIM